MFLNTDLDDSGSEDDAEITSKKPKTSLKSKKLAATTTTEKPENSDDKKLEIPFTFSVPKTSDDLEELFGGRGPKEKAIIVERMIKCNHPQFGKDSKAQMENYFLFFCNIFMIVLQ